jgi:Fcf2 pre-rRNA processing
VHFFVLDMSQINLKHFQIGTIVTTNTPFGGPSADNLPKGDRKRTLVDELVDDAEAKSYAKKKFKDLQAVRGAKGRGTLAQKKALRKPKW